MALYFAGDFHLGVPDYETSLAREKKLCRWLDLISKDAQEIFLLGDIFDFWFEYKWVIPKYYSRFFGKIAELTDKGIKVYFFKGNHDMWSFGYFKKELGVEEISDELIIDRMGYRLFIHHGDGLGEGENSYKILRKIFRSRIAQLLFSIIPTRLGLGIALWLSRRSRISQKNRFETYLGDEKEHLFQYAKNNHLKIDIFIFGHRHLIIDKEVGQGIRYINTGEWVNSSGYARLDNHGIKVLYFE